MSDEIDPAAQATELTTNPMTLQQHALQEIDKVAAGIDALAKKYTGVVFDVATTKGLDEAKAARLAIREPRYEVERVRKATASDLKKIATAVNERAASITESIRAIEDPIDAQIKAEEDRKEAEREAKKAAEAERIAGMNARLDNLRNEPVNAVGASAEELQAAIDRVAADQLDGFDEVYLPSAQSTRDGALEALRRMHAERVRLDEEAAELERQRAEQAARDAEQAETRRMQQEQEDRERAERQAREDEERKAAQAEEDRKRAEQAEADRIERERVQAEQAARQAELDQQAADQRARDEAAEQERLEAAARAEAERLAREKADAEEREQARREAEQEAIDKATLIDAAREAIEFLQSIIEADPNSDRIFQGDIDAASLLARKLAAAIDRAENPAHIITQEPLA